MRADAANIATAAALLLCAAFIASFLFGLRGEAPRPGHSAATQPWDLAAERSSGRVEVLNASGRAGLARAATDRLRSAGFDVVYFGNASAQHGDSSAVLVRTASDATARAAARQLGIAAVRQQADTTLFLDATVIIGVDWTGMPAAAESPPEEGLLTRVRRWITPGR